MLGKGDFEAADSESVIKFTKDVQLRVVRTSGGFSYTDNIT